MSLLVARSGEKDGLWCELCPQCHTGRDGVHSNREKALYVKMEAQKAAMEAYGWAVQDFISRFGRNWLDDEQGTK